MALAYSVYAVREQSLIEYRLLSRQVEAEMAYWAAMGTAERTAALLLEKENLNEALADRPPWFRDDVSLGPRTSVSLYPYPAAAPVPEEERWGVKDEGGRINLNNVPTQATPAAAKKEEGAMGKVAWNSKVLIRLLQAAGLSEGAAVSYDKRYVTAIDQAAKSSATARSGDEVAFENLLRHPYETFSFWGPQIYFGEDVNENDLLDPNENDGAGGSFPADDGSGSLQRGLRRLVTTYTDGKVNVFTCEARLLPMILADYPEVLERLEGDRGSTTRNPAVYAGAIQDPIRKGSYLRFARQFLTRDTNFVRIPVQVHGRDGSWRCGLEQVYERIRDPKDPSKSARFRLLHMDLR